MDQFQEKLLDLELKIGQIKEYPTHLMNCIKYSMVFDKNYSKDALEERITEMHGINQVLDDFLTQHQEATQNMDELSDVAHGNAQYFDDLMREHGITAKEVDEQLGFSDLPEERNNRQDQQRPGEDYDVDGSFELRKDNLTEYGRYNDEMGRDLESPL